MINNAIKYGNNFLKKMDEFDECFGYIINNMRLEIKFKKYF
jgi:hypothetical protein